jgi:hypothetical protein
MVCRNQWHESPRKSQRGSHAYKSNLEYRTVWVNSDLLILPVWDFTLDTKSSTTSRSMAFWVVLCWASHISLSKSYDFWYCSTSKHTKHINRQQKIKHIYMFYIHGKVVQWLHIMFTPAPSYLSTFEPLALLLRQILRISPQNSWLPCHLLVDSDWPSASRILQAQECALHKFWWSPWCTQKLYVGLHGVTTMSSSRWLLHLLEDPPCLWLLCTALLSSSSSLSFSSFSVAMSRIYVAHSTSCMSASWSALISFSTSSEWRYTRFFKSVISSSLFLMILLSFASKRRWRSTRTSSDATLHVFQKSDKLVITVLPQWVLASISFFSNQTSQVCSCLRVLSWFLNSIFM